MNECLLKIANDFIQTWVHSAQSYKASMSVNYNSRVVFTSKLLIFITLEMSNIIVGALKDWPLVSETIYLTTNPTLLSIFKFNPGINEIDFQSFLR